MNNLKGEKKKEFDTKLKALLDEYNVEIGVTLSSIGEKDGIKVIGRPLITDRKSKIIVPK